MTPRPSRARLPAGYGLRPDSRLLDWAAVDARIAGALHYWIGTVSRSATPHTRPIDGLWLDRLLYFGGDPQSRWQRNLAANAAATAHLEDAEHAVIMEGSVSRHRPDRTLSQRLVTASNAKYRMGQKVEDYEAQELNVFTPTVVLAWDTLYKDATRFAM